MNKIIMLMFLSVFFASSVVHGNELSCPKLFFQYSFLYDDTVCSPPDSSVNVTWAKEAKSSEAKFSSIWEKEAPAFFAHVFSNFGKGFSRKELTATLSVCEKSFNYGNPLVLRSLPYLKSYMGNKPVRTDHAFASVVFHELLHTWLNENFNYSTPLLTKYRNEPDDVLGHLHLMAIQKLVYTELGRTDLLNWLNEDYPQHKSGEPRAWEIVNKIEDYRDFIKEIKAQK